MSWAAANGAHRAAAAVVRQASRATAGTPSLASARSPAAVPGIGRRASTQTSAKARTTRARSTAAGAAEAAETAEEEAMVGPKKEIGAQAVAAAVAAAVAQGAPALKTRAGASRAKTAATTAPTTATRVSATAAASASVKKAAAVRFAAALATESAPSAPVDGSSIAAGQEAALAELKRLRLAATPTRLPSAAASGGRSGRPTDADAAPGSGSEPPKKAPRIQDTPEFKEASRKWTSVIVAIPILLVSSYFLFERLVMGHKPPDLSDYRKKTTEAAAQQQDAAEYSLARSSSRSGGGAGGNTKPAA